MEESVVEDGSEADPSQVGQHKRSGEAVELPEAEGGEEDGGPKQNDEEEPGQKVVEVEEDGRPQEVEGELDSEEEEGFATVEGAGTALRGAPYQPCCDGHEPVECGPDRSEDPVGRVEAGFGEGGVPGGKGRGCGERSDGGYGVADE